MRVVGWIRLFYAYIELTLIDNDVKITRNQVKLVKH